MKRANSAYNHVATLLNDGGLTANELSHVVALLAAQMPNAHAGLIELFLFADGVGDPDQPKLVRVTGGVDPGTMTPYGFVLNGPSKVTHGGTPEREQDRPVVRMRRMVEFDDRYFADKHNTALLCKFHEHRIPDAQDYAEKNSDELIIRFSYGHIGGGFNVHCFRPGHSHVILRGAFTLESFIPVRVEVTNG